MKVLKFLMQCISLTDPWNFQPKNYVLCLCCMLVVFDWLHSMNESAWPNSVCVGNLECSEWRCPLLPTGCVNTERNATECCEVCVDCVDPRGNPPIPAVIGNPPLDAGFVYQPLPTPTRRRKRDAIVYIASKFWVLSWSMINSRYWIVGCNIWIEVSWCWLKLNLLVLGIHGFKWSGYLSLQNSELNHCSWQHTWGGRKF